MTFVGIILTASLAQNVILVHFLGIWPFHSAVRSPGRSTAVSLMVTAALLWVSVVYWLVSRWVIAPLNAYVLETLILVVIITGTLALCVRVGGWLAPYRRRDVIELTRIGVVNMTVFVVAMGLGHNVETLPEVVIGALAAGLGVFIALVPISAVRVRFSGAHVPKALRGDVSVYLATAFMALAIQQVDRLLQPFVMPLF